MSPAELHPRTEKAFLFAQEAVKQMITLAILFFTVTLTFRKDIVPPKADTTLLELSWCVLILSVFFGLCTLLNLTGNIAQDDGTIDAGGVRLFAGLQSVSFLTALVLALTFGYTSLH